MGNALTANIHSSTLQLSSKDIAAIPPEVVNYPRIHLTKAELNNNKIRDLPDLKGVAPNLATLQLNNNELIVYSPSFMQLPNLKTLELSFNFIQSIPHVPLTLLTTLKLDHNNILSFYHDLANLYPNLNGLDLSSNRIRYLGPLKSGSLENFLIEGNFLQKISFPWVLPKVTKLSLDFNHLQILDFPDETDLSHLTSLTLRFNQVRSITPAALEKLSKLTTLNLVGNSIEDLPENLFEVLPKLTDFLASENGLTELPSSISTFAHLETLLLSENNLRRCPPLTFQSKGCRVFLSHNLLTEFPELGTDITSLSADYNQITSVPESFREKSKLAHLNLRFNRITTIPDSLVTLNLVSLNLAGNLIADIPPSVVFPPTIRFLDLSFNKLTEVPPSIAQLGQLNKLCLAFNAISHIPPWVLLLAQLKILILSCNKIRSFPSIRSLRRFVSNYKSLTKNGKKSVLSSLHSPSQSLTSLQNSQFTSPRQSSQLSTLQSTLMKFKYPNDYIANIKLRLSDREDGATLVSSLQQLTLNSNRLEKFPSIVRHFGHLQTLLLSHNRIRTIPWDLFHRLSELSRLDVSFNRLRSIPPHLLTAARIPSPLTPNITKRVDNIAYLDVSHNKISLIPLRLLYMNHSLRPFHLKQFIDPALEKEILDSKDDQGAIENGTIAAKYSINTVHGLFNESGSDIFEEKAESDYDDDEVDEEELSEETTCCSLFCGRNKHGLLFPIVVDETEWDFNDSGSEESIDLEAVPPSEIEGEPPTAPSITFRVLGAFAHSKQQLAIRIPDHFSSFQFIPSKPDTPLNPMAFIDVSFTNIGRIFFDDDMKAFVKFAHKHRSAIAFPEEEEEKDSEPTAVPLGIGDGGQTTNTEASSQNQNQPNPSTPPSSDETSHEMTTLSKTGPKNPFSGKSFAESLIPLTLMPLVTENGPRPKTTRDQMPTFSPTILPQLLYSEHYLSLAYLSTVNSHASPPTLVRCTSISTVPRPDKPYSSFASSQLFDYEFHRVEREMVGKWVSEESKDFKPTLVSVKSPPETTPPEPPPAVTLPSSSTTQLTPNSSPSQDQNSNRVELIHLPPCIDEPSRRSHPLLKLKTVDESETEDEKRRYTTNVVPFDRFRYKGGVYEAKEREFCDVCFDDKKEMIESEADEETTNPQNVPADEPLATEPTTNPLTDPSQPSLLSHSPVRPPARPFWVRKKHTKPQPSVFNKPCDRTSMAIHNFCCVETNGQRPSMEDSVVMLPCGGWDLNALMEDGEIGILRRLLTYPQEYRFTTRGMRTMEMREERMWDERMKRRERRKRMREYAERGLSAAKIAEREKNIEKRDRTKHFDCPYNHAPLRGCGLFGVIDGHGGAEAAVYTASHFPSVLLEVAEREGVVRRNVRRQREQDEEERRKKEEERRKKEEGKEKEESVEEEESSEEEEGVESDDNHSESNEEETNEDHSSPSIHSQSDVQTSHSAPNKPTRLVTPPPNPPTTTNTPPVAPKPRAPLPPPPLNESSFTPYILVVMREALRVLDERMRLSGVKLAGACCVFAIVTPDKVYVANIGDCRAVLVSRFVHQLKRTSEKIVINLTRPTNTSTDSPQPSKASPLAHSSTRPQSPGALSPFLDDFPLPRSSTLRNPFLHSDGISTVLMGKDLSCDHKPLLERERDYIYGTGWDGKTRGYVTVERRVNGRLAVARALGDYDSKPAVSAECDVYGMELARWKGVKIQTRRGSIQDTTSPTLSGSSNGLSQADLNALTRVLDEHLKPLAPYPSIEHDFNEKHKAFLEANIPRFCLPKTHSEYFPSKLYSHSSNTPLTSSPPVCDGGVFERQDVCIVLGCDGLFDVLDGEQIAEVACPWMRDDGSWMSDPVFDSDSDDEVGGGGRRGGRGKGKEVVVEEWNEENLEKNAKSMSSIPDAVEHAVEDADEDAEAEPTIVSSHSSESDSIFEPSPFTQLPSSHPPISSSSHHPPKTRSRRRQNGLGRHKNKGRLAELAALRLKSASDAMESLDNISIIVLFL